MKKLLVLSIAFLLLFGCISFEQPDEQPLEDSQLAGDADQPEGEDQAEEGDQPEGEEDQFSYLPLHLSYRLPIEMDKNGTELQVIYMDYYLDQMMECEGRDALIGVLRLGSEPWSDLDDWSKITIYLDDGSYAVSNYMEEADLLFDDAVSTKPEFNLALMMSGWFASEGKNFNTATVWGDPTPTIMENKEVFGNYYNLSIVNSGEKVVNDFECTEFSVAIKSEDRSFILKFCVMERDEDMPLPFVVSMYVDGHPELVHFELKEFDHEDTPVQYYPQCFEVVNE